ncbi:haloacid dehalogenase, type II [Exophiala spinifera]|uniref:Haloacid dehalogenase, type II n=1 Tax=Exophiala spinifera TaxID=91928 RepID=A0A0D1YQ43_9EURO|nr:haloacid dehalogenase, type II [Exophiala spinifera]KIW17356.1 haloacid dehalogenase, type II [Exophiala spinifera]
MPDTKIKAVFFDFMGTCLDWHSGTIQVFPSSISQSERSKLALEWRHDYFDANAARLAAEQPPEDIDITLRTTLNALLEKHSEYKIRFDEQTKDRCITAWHSMPAWPDVAPAIDKLKAAGYEIFVFANGTPRLQLDLCKTSGLKFDMLFSSELLGVYKPSPESYRKTLDLVKVKPQAAVMVAAHAYDTRGAKEAGMKTVYIHRWTDDINEDMEVVRRENDFFLEDMTDLPAVISQMSILRHEQ